jgi:hypothetical protein
MTKRLSMFALLLLLLLPAKPIDQLLFFSFAVAAECLAIAC